MITLHGKEVRVGDKVWDMKLGWGVVEELFDKNQTRYPIGIQWEVSYARVSEDGKYSDYDAAPTLFWQPLEYKIPEKPKPKEKAWQWVHKIGEKYWITRGYYTSKEDVMNSLHNAEPIEPYLPSEIEREIKE